MMNDREISSEKLSSKGLNSRGIQKLIKNLLPIIENDIEETLPEKLLYELKLPNKKRAIFDIHIPKNNEDYLKAQKRLKFDEFFFFQLHLLNHYL